MLRLCGGTYAPLCELAPVYVKLRPYEWKCAYLCETAPIWVEDVNSTLYMQRDINLSFNTSANSLQSLGHIYLYNNALQGVLSAILVCTHMSEVQFRNARKEVFRFINLLQNLLKLRLTPIYWINLCQLCLKAERDSGVIVSKGFHLNWDYRIQDGWREVCEW